MQGITRRQIVPSVKYQEELRKQEQLFVVVGKSGSVLTRPLPRITCEHFLSKYRIAGARIEEAA